MQLKRCLFRIVAVINYYRYVVHFLLIYFDLYFNITWI